MRNFVEIFSYDMPEFYRFYSLTKAVVRNNHQTIFQKINHSGDKILATCLLL